MHLKEKKKFIHAKSLLKILTAYIITAFGLVKNKKPIIVVGGNLGEKYEDNAAVFHQYLLKNYSQNATIYWLYDENTSYVKTSSIPHSVKLGSLRNYILFFRADYSFHGHSIAYDLAPFIDRYIFLNRKTIMTHISHGIECFKKILIQKEDIPLLARCDYFNCASEYEKQIKLHEWKIPPEKLIVTGMARFDALPQKHAHKEIKNVLIMFTWREWLFSLSEEDFIASEYFQRTLHILQDERLSSIIHDYDLHVKVVLHPFMKKYESLFQSFYSEEFKIDFYTFDEISIRKEIVDAHMLLTDYSSICWDFLYMNKPIIFYTFDQEEFLSRRGSYLDMDKDLFGYKADTLDDVIRYLQTIVYEKEAHNVFYSMAFRFIDYFDGQNCKRLAEKILSADSKVISKDLLLLPDFQHSQNHDKLQRQ